MTAIAALRLSPNSLAKSSTLVRILSSIDIDIFFTIIIIILLVCIHYTTTGILVNSNYVKKYASRHITKAVCAGNPNPCAFPS
jgi:hypothetical protein